MNASARGDPSANASGLAERRQQSLGPAYRLFYDEPLHIVQGSGVWLTDKSGRRYLDMYNNVPHVGHCHPQVVAAIEAQARRLNTHTRYLHENVVEYAERLLSLAPESVDVAMFSCTGSEANELALRVARTATGQQGVVVIEHAYHGNSQATFEISTEDVPLADRPPWVISVPAPDRYRGEHRGADAGLRYAESLHGAIATLRERGEGFAAFIIDTIASSSGVVEPPPGYLRAVSDIVKAEGGLFIADEVQPGLGRTGRHFWGHTEDGVEPDIVTLGKPLGNGHPLAATLLRRELAERFAKTGSYFNTFGGNPVSAAAGLAVLDIVESEGLQENARVQGEFLKGGLAEIAADEPLIGDVRGHGLFLAVELIEDGELSRPATGAARHLVNALKGRGILTSMIGPDANTLKLRPPMVLARTDAEFFLEQFRAALMEPAAH